MRGRIVPGVSKEVMRIEATRKRNPGLRGNETEPRAMLQRSFSPNKNKLQRTA